MCGQSIFDTTEGCSVYKDDAWYALVNVTKFGVGPLSDTNLLESDPAVQHDLCAKPGGEFVWQPGDPCTTKWWEESGGVCGLGCYCDNTTDPTNPYLGTCALNISIGSDCGKAFRPATGTLDDTNVGDSCYTDTDCGFRCVCRAAEGGGRECQRADWSIPDEAKTQGIVFDQYHEELDNTNDILSCFLRTLRVWNDGQVEYFKDGQWETCFNENWEIPPGSPCEEIVGLSIVTEEELHTGGYFALALIDRTYTSQSNYSAFDGDCYDPAVYADYSNNPCVCACAKQGYNYSANPQAVCDPVTDGCGQINDDYDARVSEGDDFCTQYFGTGTWPGSGAGDGQDYACCCRGAPPSLSQQFNNYVVVSNLYLAKPLAGAVLGVDESNYYDVLRETLREETPQDVGKKPYYFTYTLARACDIVGSIDDDADCKGEITMADFGRSFQGISTPNYYAEIAEKGFDDCTWMLIDGGKFCEWPGVYIAMMNKSRFGISKGFENYVILGKEDLTTRRIYNRSITDDDFTNKNDVLEWNWWAGHRLLGCDLCEPGDDTCSMGASLAMWYLWHDVEDGRQICGFLDDIEAGQPDAEFVGESIRSIETDVDALFVQDTTWNGKCPNPGANSPSEDYPTCGVDEDKDGFPDGFECWAYQFTGDVDYASPMPFGPSMSFGAFVPKCYLPWQNDFWFNEGGGQGNWNFNIGSEETSQHLDYTYEDDYGNQYDIDIFMPVFNPLVDVDSGWGVIIDDMTYQEHHFNYSDYPMEGDCASDVEWATCDDDEGQARECVGLSQENDGRLEETVIPCGNGQCVADVAACFAGCYAGLPYVGGGESPYTYGQTLYDEKTRTDSFWEGVDITEFQTEPFGEECTVPGFDSAGWIWWVYKHAGVPYFSTRYTSPDSYRELLRVMVGEEPPLATEICSCGGCTHDFILANAQPGDLIFLDPCGTETPICPSPNVCHVAVYLGGGEIAHAKLTSATSGVGIVREPIPAEYFNNSQLAIDSIFRVLNFQDGGPTTYECEAGAGGAIPPAAYDPTAICTYADFSCEQSGKAPCGDEDYVTDNCPAGDIIDAPYLTQCSTATAAAGGSCEWVGTSHNCICRYGCGPTALSMALDYHGYGTDIDLLKGICHTESPTCPAGTCGEGSCDPDECCTSADPTCGCTRATSWGGLMDAVERITGAANYDYISSGGSVTDIANAVAAGNPVIARINHHNINYKQHNCQENVASYNGHYVLVVGLSADQSWIIINDPNVPAGCNEKITMPMSAFYAAWQDKGRQALVVTGGGAPSAAATGPKSLSASFGQAGGQASSLAADFSTRDDCFALTPDECATKNANGCNLDCGCFAIGSMEACLASGWSGCYPIQCSQSTDVYETSCIPIAQPVELPTDWPGSVGNPMPAQPNMRTFTQELSELNTIPVDKINALPDRMTTRMVSEIMEGDAPGIKSIIDLPSSPPIDKIEPKLERIIEGIVQSKTQSLIQELVLSRIPNGGRVPDPYAFMPSIPQRPDVPLSLEISQYTSQWPDFYDIPVPEEDPATEPIDYPRLGVLSDVHGASQDLHDGVVTMNYYIEEANAAIDSYKTFADTWNEFRRMSMGVSAYGSISFSTSDIKDQIMAEVTGGQLDSLCDGLPSSACESAINAALADVGTELDNTPDFSFTDEVAIQLGYDPSELPILPTDVEEYEPLPEPPVIADYNDYIPQLYSCDSFTPSAAALPQKSAGSQASVSSLGPGDPQMPIPALETLTDVHYPAPEVPDFTSLVTGAGRQSPYVCSRPRHKDYEGGPTEPYDPSKWDLIDGPINDYYPPGIDTVDGHTKPVYCSEDLNHDGELDDKNDPDTPFACFDYDLKYYRQFNRNSLWSNVFQMTPEVYAENPSVGTEKTCREVYDANRGGNAVTRFFTDLFTGDETLSRSCENADNIVAGGCWFQYPGDECHSCLGDEENDHTAITHCNNYSMVHDDDDRACVEDWCGVGPCEWDSSAAESDLRCSNVSAGFTDRCTDDCGIDCTQSRCDHIAEYVDQDGVAGPDGCWFEPSPFRAGSACHNCEVGPYNVSSCGNYTTPEACLRNRCDVSNDPGNGEFGCVWDLANDVCREAGGIDLNTSCGAICGSAMYSAPAASVNGIWVQATSCTKDKCDKADELLAGGCWFTRPGENWPTGTCSGCLGGANAVKSCEDYSRNGGYTEDSCNDNPCEANKINNRVVGCGWTEKQGCLSKDTLFEDCNNMCGEGWFNKCDLEECSLLSEVIPGGCWFDSTADPDTCWNCLAGDRPISGCREYTNDRACLTNPCNIPGGCGWDGEACIGAVNLDMDVYTRTGNAATIPLPGPIPSIPILDSDAGGPTWIHAGAGFTLPNEDEAKKLWNEQKDFGFYESTGPFCLSTPFIVDSYFCFPNPITLIQRMRSNAIHIDGSITAGGHCGFRPLDVVPSECGEICGKEVMDLNTVELPSGDIKGVWPDYETWINTTIEEHVDLGSSLITEIITQGRKSSNDVLYNYTYEFSGNIFPVPYAPFKLLNWFNVEHSLSAQTNQLNITGYYHANSTMRRRVNTLQCAWHGCDLVYVPGCIPPPFGPGTPSTFMCKGQWHRYGCTYPVYVNFTIPVINKQGFTMLPETFHDHSWVSYEPYGDHLKVDKMEGLPGAIDIDVEGYVDYKPTQKPMGVRGRLTIRGEPDLINGFNLVLPGVGVVEYARNEYPALHKLFRTNTTGQQYTIDHGVAEKIYLDQATKDFLARGEVSSINVSGERQEIDWSKPWYYWMRNPLVKFYDMSDLYYAEDSIYSWYVNLQCKDCGFLWFDKSEDLGLFRNYHEDESRYYDLAAFGPVPRPILTRATEDDGMPLQPDVNIRYTSLDNRSIIYSSVVYNEEEKSFTLTFSTTLGAVEPLEQGFVRVYTPLRYKDIPLQSSIPVP